VGLQDVFFVSEELLNLRQCREKCGVLWLQVSGTFQLFSGTFWAQCLGIRRPAISLYLKQVIEFDFLQNPHKITILCTIVAFLYKLNNLLVGKLTWASGVNTMHGSGYRKVWINHRK
jgi:hypothetical protein